MVKVYLLIKTYTLILVFGEMVFQRVKANKDLINKVQAILGNSSQVLRKALAPILGKTEEANITVNLVEV